MIIRIISGGKTAKDFTLTEASVFTIGSGSRDSVSFPHTDLSRSHVSIAVNGGEAYMKCSGSVYFKGTDAVSEKTLSIQESYLLSQKYGIAFMTVPETSGSAGVIDLDSHSKISVGRATDNDLIVSSGLVSRHHFTITRLQNGFQLEDCNSSNGIFLNGSVLRKPILLHDGDAAFFGDATVSFRNKKLSIQYPAQYVKIQHRQGTTLADNLWDLIGE